MRTKQQLEAAADTRRLHRIKVQEDRLVRLIRSMGVHCSVDHTTHVMEVGYMTREIQMGEGAVKMGGVWYTYPKRRTRNGGSQRLMDFINGFCQTKATLPPSPPKTLRTNIQGYIRGVQNKLGQDPDYDRYLTGQLDALRWVLRGMKNP